ncbi:hypothetical protein HF521_007879 [Silurus meridionalis]|uniref:HAT C-terminal dimerisation domain-containing protein n=1 Tax=Silurus meridionalis TaxID=175797 RepID=A0A8T0AMU7_SILME|nr:hypothetical protein HF521_007879 [Silurus meridionalis]
MQFGPARHWPRFLEPRPFHRWTKGCSLAVCARIDHRGTADVLDFDHFLCPVCYAVLRKYPAIDGALLISRHPADPIVHSFIHSFIHGHHFDSGRLRSELQVLYSDQDLQGNRGKLCDYLVFLKDMELDSAMPQLYKLFSLVATIGATSAGVERSFSCLKRLKSYTRNTMGQGRLSSLALLAIERTLVKSLEKTPSWYDRVTDHFLEKERRAEFTFK